VPEHSNGGAYLKLTPHRAIIVDFPYVYLKTGMSLKLDELPLFPLHTVLFPYANLRLHIFEDRYREMIRLCLEDNRPFGVVLIRDGVETGPADPYLVGTAARIIGAETYDDGRMDIQILGESRFRIRELDDQTQPFLLGRVEPVVEHEMPSSLHVTEVMEQARSECEVLIKRIFAPQHFQVEVKFPEDPVAFSFTIANLLPMENLEKQRLLETTDTLERMEDLLPILRGHINDALPETSYFRLRATDLSEWILPN
jgi:Lon protease-like protein